MRSLLILFAGLLCAGLSAADSFKFDFGPRDMPAAEGWTRVHCRETFKEQPGYGWVKQWGNDFPNDSGNAPELKSVTGASVPGMEATFLVTIPDGVYQVTVQLGSTIPTEGRDGQCVEINGKAVLPPPGVGGWGKMVKRTLPAVVTEGKMTIRFYTTGTKGTNRLNIFSLEIAPAPKDQTGEIRRQFEELGSSQSAAVVREVEVNGIKITETGRKASRRPPEFSAAEKQDGMVFFTTAVSGDILDYMVPRRDEIIKETGSFACAGEIRPYFAGLHALEDLQIEKMEISGLTSGTHTIPADNAELYTLTSVYRSPYDYNHLEGKLVAELLEKNFKSLLKKSTTQPLYLTIRVPPGQAPGNYQGKLTVHAQSKAPVSLNIALTVLPLELQKNRRQSWVLGVDSGRWNGMPEKNVMAEIRDMAAHGANGLMIGIPPVDSMLIESDDGKIVGIDFDRLGKYLSFAHEQGMDGTLIMSATQQLLWRLPYWSIKQTGEASRQIIEQAGRHYFQAIHSADGSSTDVYSAGFPPLPSPRQYRLYVRYCLESGNSAQLQFQRYDTHRKPIGSALYLALPPAGEFAEAVMEIAADNPAALYTLGISWRGKGSLTIDRVTLSPQDRPELNLVNNYRLLREIGNIDYDKPWPEKTAAAFRDVIHHAGEAARKLGFQPYFAGTDEAGNNPKTEFREITELKMVKEAGEKSFCNLSPALGKKIQAILDIPCFYADLLGSAENTHRMLAEHRRLGKQLYTISAGTYAGQNFSILPNRYNAGCFLWRSGLDGLWLWTFQRPRNDPFNDFDSPTKDYCMVYPPRPGSDAPVASIGWEGIREGIRDYQYIYTLEEAIAKAEKAGRTQAAAQGHTVINFLHRAIPWYNGFSETTFNDVHADRLRWLAAWGAMTVNAQFKIPGTRLNQQAEIACRKTAEQPAPEQVKPVIIPVLLVPPQQDGTLNDPLWRKALQITEFYEYMNGARNNKSGNVLYLAHDKDNFYVGFKSEQKPVTAAPGNTENAVFGNSHVELFFDTALDRNNYFQLAFDADGNRADLKCRGSRNVDQSIFAVNYGEPNIRDAAWNGNWQVKTSKTADGWTATAIIPFKTIGRENDEWGFLCGFNSGKTNYATKAIGYFDQPDKFPVITLGGNRNGSSVLKHHNLGAFAIGKASADLAFDNLRAGKVTVRIESQDGTEESFKGTIRPNGTIAVNYRLLPSSRAITLGVESESGELLRQSKLPLAIPAALQFDCPRQIFFEREQPFAATITPRISASSAQHTQMHLELVGDGKTIAKASIPAGKNEISIPLNNLNYGFYALKITLNEGAVTYAEQTLDFAVVPSFN